MAGNIKGKVRGRTLKSVIITGLAAVVVVCSQQSVIVDSAKGVAERAAILSAALALPDGGLKYLSPDSADQQPPEPDEIVTQGSAGRTPAENKNDETNTPPVAITQVNRPAATTTPPEKNEPDIPKENRGAVSAALLYTQSANMSFENVYVKNVTDAHTFDIEEELGKKPGVKIKKNNEPQVLIMHTHTTESYQPADSGYYDMTESAHSLDRNLSVVKVGDAITRQLNDAGILTLHDETVHDYPSYNGAYDRSAETVQKYLDEYPSIQVVLDIHRDAITDDSGVKTKPTAEIDGKKAAQIMIISGCEEYPIIDYPDWEINLRFALRIQKQLETDYPTLARPLYFAARHYNQQMTHGSLLIEMGSDGNTLEEAVYSGEMLGKALAELLATLK